MNTKGILKVISYSLLLNLFCIDNLQAQFHRNSREKTSNVRGSEDGSQNTTQKNGLFSFLKKSSTPLQRRSTTAPTQQRAAETSSPRRPLFGRIFGRENGGSTATLGGHAITICLPSNRNNIGSIRFGGRRCAAKGMGIYRDRAVRKADTPTGVYKVRGLGGNTRGQWGTKGLQIVATWGGSTNQQGERGRGNSTSDLFIHTRSNIHGPADLAGKQSWGCPLIPKDCMTDLQNFYRNSGSPSNMTVNITERCI